METREFRLIQNAELRAASDSRTVRGYAAVFNSASRPLGPTRYREYIRRGAFARSLSGDIVGLYNHDAEHVLGRTSAGTMSLAEDETGLATEIDLPPTTIGKDVYELVKRRDLKGMSFGFNINRDEWNRDRTVRTLLDIELHEVSIVALPSYESTSIEARSVGLPSHTEVLVYEGIGPHLVSDEERERLRLRVELLRRL